MQFFNLLNYPTNIVVWILIFYIFFDLILGLTPRFINFLWAQHQFFLIKLERRRKVKEHKRNIFNKKQHLANFTLSEEEINSIWDAEDVIK